MRKYRPFSCGVAVVVLFGTLSRAQPAPHSRPEAVAADPVQLSPFEIVAEDDGFYQAANTLGATRTNVAIRDLPMQINVVTEQFLVDRALFDLNQVLDVIPGTGRTGGEFLPLVNIRGFTSLHAMRNGVRGVTMPDMTSIVRVEAIKGPAALIYGWTNPGGVINYITKNPSPKRQGAFRLSGGSDQLRRFELDATGPLVPGGTINYRLGLTRYRVEKREGERSLDRAVVTPMLQWKPRPGTNVTVRYNYTHDDIRPGEGLVLKPRGAVNRGGDPSQFYPFNGLDPIRNPEWVTSVGPDFIRDSPSSYRDLRSSVGELEVTQRLGRALDLRVNLAYHRRARSSIRESDTALINPWTQTSPTIAQLAGYNGWNLDNSGADPFPEARFTYGLAGRIGDSGIGDALADTRLLDGRPYVYNPGVRTLQYVDGVTGWRRVTWQGNNRRERRLNGQLELFARFRAGAIEQTLLTGVEHNEDRRWENNSMLLRDPSLPGVAVLRIPNSTTPIPNTVHYYYNIFDPVSTAARDAFAQRNLPPLSRFTSNGTTTDQRLEARAVYANWSATFLADRGRLALGARYDDVATRLVQRDPGGNPIGFGGVVKAATDGTSSRATPQAGVSFRIAGPVTLYALYSQSVNPQVNFQPARTPTAESDLRTRYREENLPPPNLDALPWGQFLDPQFGVGVEYGVKANLWGDKATINVGWFTIDRRNVARLKPASHPDSTGGFFDLTGHDRARGVDLDFQARPWRGLQIGGGALYNQTEVVAANAATLATPIARTFAEVFGPNATVSTVGQPLLDAAKWSGNGYVRYEFSGEATKGLSLGAGYVYMGPRREDVVRWSEAWSRWDANASYRRKLLNRLTTFSVVVRNLTARTFRVEGDVFARPRQFVGSVSVEF